MADGLSKVNIQYTYHTHEGSEGTTVNGCYTQAKYHSHSSSCYSTCGGQLRAIEKGYESGQYYDDKKEKPIWKAMQKCDWCGVTSYDLGVAQQQIGQSLGKCAVSKLNCNKGNNIIGYSLGCGKTEETIESATIIY